MKPGKDERFVVLKMSPTVFRDIMITQCPDCGKETTIYNPYAKIGNLFCTSCLSRSTIVRVSTCMTEEDIENAARNN